MGTHYSPRMITDGLALCLDAGNPKSYSGTGTTWYDLSGNNNHAVLVGTTSFVTWNSAGYFDHDPGNTYFGATSSTTSGSTDYGAYWNVPHSASLNPNGGFWSVCGWAKVVGDQSANGVGWFHKLGSTSEKGVHLEPISGNFRINGDSSWGHINYNINNSSVWQYFSVTFSQSSGTYGTDTGVLKFYINGSLAAESSTFYPSADDGDSIWLGRRNGHLRHFMKGHIQGYQYYTKTLSQSEINTNFNISRTRFGV
jgi:hypothetical protein